MWFRVGGVCGVLRVLNRIYYKCCRSTVSSGIGQGIVREEQGIGESSVPTTADEP